MDTPGAATFYALAAKLGLQWAYRGIELKMESRIFWVCYNSITEFVDNLCGGVLTYENMDILVRSLILPYTIYNQSQASYFDSYWLLNCLAHFNSTFVPLFGNLTRNNANGRTLRSIPG